MVSLYNKLALRTHNVPLLFSSERIWSMFGGAEVEFEVVDGGGPP